MKFLVRTGIEKFTSIGGHHSIILEVISVTTVWILDILSLVFDVSSHDSKQGRSNLLPLLCEKTTLMRINSLKSVYLQGLCFLFFPISLLMMEACKEEPYVPPIVDTGRIVFSSFPEVVHLYGRNEGPRDVFGQLRDIASDSGMFVVSDMANDTVFHLLDGALQRVQRFGKEGEGPDELKFDPLLSKHHFARMGRFFCYEFARRSLTAWPFEGQKVREDTFFRYRLPDTVVYVQQVMVVDSALCVALAEMQEGKLCFFNPFATPPSVLSFSPYVPQIEGGQDVPDMGHYRGKLAASPEGDEIVCVNSSFPQLEIYDRNGNLKKEVRSAEIEQFLSPDNRKDFFFYYDVDVTDKYIYALYLGLNKKSPAAILLGTDSRIHVFDREGMPVAEVVLDRLVNAFCVDEKTGRIVGIDEGEEARPLVTWQLPEDLY